MSRCSIVWISRSRSNRSDADAAPELEALGTTEVTTSEDISMGVLFFFLGFEIHFPTQVEVLAKGDAVVSWTQTWQRQIGPSAGIGLILSTHTPP